MSLPKGYKPHDGGECPVDPQTFVDCIVRTAERAESGTCLLGHSGVMRARLHEWNHKAVGKDGKILHANGIGAVVGYRLATREEKLSLDEMIARWPEAQ